MSVLHRGMSLEEFDNGYFYAADLKVFAREIGITVGNFRKFELEELIREFLRTGKVPDHKPVMPRRAGGARDELKPIRSSPTMSGTGELRTSYLSLSMPKHPT